MTRPRHRGTSGQAIPGIGVPHQRSDDRLREDESRHHEAASPNQRGAQAPAPSIVVPFRCPVQATSSTVTSARNRKASARCEVETASGRRRSTVIPPEHGLHEEQPDPGQPEPEQDRPLRMGAPDQNRGDREKNHERAGPEAVEVLPENAAGHLGRHRAEAGRPVRAGETGSGRVDVAAQEEQRQSPEEDEEEEGDVPSTRRRVRPPLTDSVSGRVPAHRGRRRRFVRDPGRRRCRPRAIRSDRPWLPGQSCGYRCRRCGRPRGSCVAIRRRASLQAASASSNGARFPVCFAGELHRPGASRGHDEEICADVHDPVPAPPAAFRVRVRSEAWRGRPCGPASARRGWRRRT